MGLFDMFTKEGRFKRHARRMSHRDAPPEDREVSAQWLFDQGTPEAISALLTRFDLTLTQQLKDRKEKEWVYSMLVQLGDPVVEPLEAWLRKCKQFAWPLKLLGELRGEGAALKMAYELLEAEKGRNAFAPEKKKALLVWLADRKDDGAIDAASDYLDDFDEGVRYAASEVCINQGGERAVGLLHSVLSREDEDSNRLKVRVCDVFVSRGWPADPVALEGKLPSGYDASSGRIRPTH